MAVGEPRFLHGAGLVEKRGPQDLCPEGLGDINHPSAPGFQR